TYLFEGLPDGDYVVTVGVPGEEPGAVDDGIADRAENTADPDGGTPNQSAVTLTPTDREDLDQDFGYAGINSLGDTVFLDEGGDGVQNPTDDGIADVDVTVTWYGPNGVLGGGDDVTIGTATTDDQGAYLFDNLPDGTFAVDVVDSTVPDGLDLTVDVGDADTPAAGSDPDGRSEVTLQSTDDGNGNLLPDENLDQDFGYVPGGSISGRIVFDLDGGDDDDATEPGVPGVTVTLVGPDGLRRTTTTDPNGEYEFTGLPAGDYVVTVDQDTLPDGVTFTFDTDAPTGVAEPGDGDGVQDVTLGTNPDGTVEDVVDIDSGVVADGRIGDTIYLDQDGDGVQDTTPGSGEVGIPGQVVTLLGDGADGVFGTPDDITRTTTTDENGEYLFEGLPDGDYVVTVGSPEAPGITERAENTGDPDGGTPNQSEVTLADGDREDLDQDFGYRGPNSIGDTVFLDENADGIQDPTDDGIENVTVTVTWHGLDDVFGTADDVEYTATTDANGEYTVEDLPDGTYTVMLDPATLPDDADPTVDAADQPGDPIDGMSTVVLGDDVDDPSDVTQGEDEDGVDFGVVPGGSISGTVVLDIDGNDVQDVGESGLEGVTVILTGPGPDGIVGTPDDIDRTTTTDENGDYSFPGLPAGDYEVTIDDTTLPDDTTATFDTDPDGADNPDRTTSVTLEETPDGDVEDKVDVDFGEQGPGVIGGVVYVDTDGDGTQDPDEPGQPGQPVTITWAGPDGVFGPGPDGDTDDVTFPTTTDENGEYEVDGLPDGDYRIDIGPGLPDVADPTEDPDGSGDNTSLVTLDPDDRTETDQDFGYTGDNSIGDTVFIDANTNGVDDGPATDPRVDGAEITVTWYGPDGVEGTADDVVFPTVTTDEDGQYTVDGLPDGTYVVELDPATLPSGTAPAIDPDGGTPDGVSVVTVEGGQDDDEQDFGVTGGATLGDTVWLDLDGDGTRDLGEPGVTGAIVTATFVGADGELGTDDDVVFM
ncbi:MAG: SdrD B-like domain-containing protein, partial [Actinomycetota bacterium]